MLLSAWMRTLIQQQVLLVWYLVSEAKTKQFRRELTKCLGFSLAPIVEAIWGLQSGDATCTQLMAILDGNMMINEEILRYPSFPS
jgi:UDP-3-O-acyl-N-acetylglucosamine deacetylase